METVLADLKKLALKLEDDEKKFEEVLDAKKKLEVENSKLKYRVHILLESLAEEERKLASRGITTETKGEVNTLEWRMFFKRDGAPISPWHDIPLNIGEGIYNMVVEIPRGTNAKLEMSTSEERNPIRQDIKNGKLRFVADVHGFKGYFCNYGAFPQTWEDPSFVHPATNAKGDKDPLDVVEIGEKVHPSGSIVPVKVLGVLGLIDEGETDWKVIVIDITDPLAGQLNDVADVERYKPGYLTKAYEWFRDYKIPDGKPENKFAFDGKVQNKVFALKVVEENAELWAKKYKKH